MMPATKAVWYSRDIRYLSNSLWQARMGNFEVALGGARRWLPTSLLEDVAANGARGIAKDLMMTDRIATGIGGVGGFMLGEIIVAAAEDAGAEPAKVISADLDQTVFGDRQLSWVNTKDTLSRAAASSDISLGETTLNLYENVIDETSCGVTAISQNQFACTFGSFGVDVARFRYRSGRMPTFVEGMSMLRDNV